MTTAPLSDNLDIPVPQEQEPKRKIKRGLGRNEITMNLVAMLDLAFNILIFFIITANFAVHEGVISSKVPQTDGTSSALPPLTELKISITPQGSIFIEGSTSQPADYTRLAEILASIQLNDSNPSGAYKPDTPVVITPDFTTPWQDVVNAFNASIKARYTNVGFGSVKQN